MLTGPSFFPGCVPVFTETSEWYSPKDGKMETHSWTMAPLRLCYAWTIWKAQGQTFRSKVIVNLSEREREHGLTYLYTVFSRVTKPTDLGIIIGFPRARLMEKVRDQTHMKARIKEERRLNGKVIKTLSFLKNLPSLDHPDVLET